MADFPFSYYLIVRDSYLREVGLIRPAEQKAKSSLPYEMEGDPEAFE